MPTERGPYLRKNMSDVENPILDIWGEPVEENVYGESHR